MSKPVKKDFLSSLQLVSVFVRLLFIICVTVLISCGKNNISWPANINGFSDFKGEDQENIIKFINDLNSRHTRPFLTFNNEYSINQKIHFKMMDNDLPPKDRFMVVAQAWVRADECTIEVFPEAFAGNIIEPAIWHELGHCSGLEHSKNPEDIMYYTVKPMESYSQDAIDRFMFDLSKSLK